MMGDRLDEWWKLDEEYLDCLILEMMECLDSQRCHSEMPLSQPTMLRTMSSDVTSMRRRGEAKRDGAVNLIMRTQTCD